MGKREELGMAAGKGVVSGAARWATVAALGLLVGGGAWAGISAANDDDDDRDEPTTSQVDD